MTCPPILDRYEVSPGVDFFNGSRLEPQNNADITIMMFFFFWVALGIPVFLNRRHMREAFARGHR